MNLEERIRAATEAIDMPRRHGNGRRILPSRDDLDGIDDQYFLAVFHTMLVQEIGATRWALLQLKALKACQERFETLRVWPSGLKLAERIAALEATVRNDSIATAKGPYYAHGGPLPNNTIENGGDP